MKVPNLLAFDFYYQQLLFLLNHFFHIKWNFSILKNTYLTVETFLRKISKPCRAAGTAPEHSTTTSAP